MPRQEDIARLDQLLASVEASLTAMAAQVIHDHSVRLAYEREVRRGVFDIADRFKNGLITNVEAAAREAVDFRNNSLETLRLRTSPLGLQIAKNLKAQGKTFNELVAKYTIEAHGKQADFNRLTTAQKNAIFARTLEKAGTPNSSVTTMLRRLQPAARGVAVVGISYSFYVIATSDDKIAAATREGGGLAAGVLGGVAGGAAAGLMCGPGAPACVTAGAFVGGLLAAFGVELAFSAWR